MAKLLSSMEMQNAIGDEMKVETKNGKVAMVKEQCVTQEMNRKIQPFEDELPEGCKITKTASGNTYTTKAICSDPPETTTVTTVVFTPTKFKARIEVKDSANGDTYMDMVSQWISPVCGNVPVDDDG